MDDQTVMFLTQAVRELAVQVEQLTTIVGATLDAIVTAREADARSAATMRAVTEAWLNGTGTPRRVEGDI